ncbi:hypothetical protein BB561_006565 [Smittium simulii]|uniref:Mitochondrial dicarboxylate transporter n=1 Tax=Smittium simulii TaxID=133385 RepID=A0A2T9Y385_9FUNG|nr:hypothetical protein BB561_006565 [Smittium simulii]
MSNNIQTPLYFGGIASVITTLFSHPGDLIKVRLQAYRGELKSSIQVIKDIYRYEGIKGYFNGMSAGMLRQATYSTVRFGVYETLLVKMKQKNGQVSLWQVLVAGCAGGAIGGLVGNPADVANVRMQNDASLPVSQRRNYNSVFDALGRIVKEEGVGKLYLGLIPNIGMSMAMTASQIGSYDIFKQILVYYGMRDSSPYTHFSSSVLASLVAATVVSPIDVAKTRIMDSNVKIYNGLFDALVTIPRKEGMVALFKGWTPAFLRLAPHTIIMFLILEQMKKYYIEYNMNSQKLDTRSMMLGKN